MFEMGWETRRSDGESKGEGTGQWVAAAIRGRIWFLIRLGLKSRSTGGRKWDQGRARGQRPTGRRRNGSGEGGVYGIVMMMAGASDQWQRMETVWPEGNL